MATKKPRASTSSRGGGVKATEIKLKKADVNSLLGPVVELVRTSADTSPGGSLPPPYDPEKLYDLFEDSAWLPPCVEAYVTNIESFGHHFVPAFNLDGPDVLDRVSDAMMLEAAADNTARGEMPPEPSEADVRGRLDELRRLARYEYAKLKVFFARVCPQFAFVELRRRMRKDLEVTGNAYWEVTRNGAGEVAHMYYIPAISIRLMPLDKKSVRVEERVRLSEISWTVLERERFFRTRMLLHKGKPRMYFKEFGDNRVMSRASGKTYANVEAMRAKEPEALEATELLQFSIHSPTSPYGVPRWCGTMPAVLGSKARDGVNLKYFNNSTVPPLALLVSGGRLAGGSAERIKDHIQEQLKGQNSFHRMLILEAEGQKAIGEPGPKAVPKLQFVPLRDAQLNDATFQEYDEANELKISKSFRLPRLLRGDDANINKATAWAALRFAEEQVFEPERELFDEFINRTLLPELGIVFWTFRSNSPITRDPEVQATIVANLVKTGVLLPNEARTIASDIFNRQLVEISEEWTNQPLPIVLAQLRRFGLAPGEDAGEEDEDEETAGGTATAADEEAPSTRPRAGEAPSPRLVPAGSPLMSTTGTDD